jgi:CO/xanthine dehydrogenase FAD-binding subunit
MAEAPGRWTPIAGGTELMVAHAAAGSPPPGSSASGIFLICASSRPADALVVGAGATFTDMRTNAAIASDFPLLARAATWIGSIANQNRATLGGNLVNGSPAADSSPALLVYDAEVELVSVRGRRRIAYSAFHTGYKMNVLGR